MLTKTIDVSEVEMSVKELLSLMQVDTEIVIAAAGTPLARLLPILSVDSLPKAGLHPGAIKIITDFDRPLAEEFWTGDA